MSFADIEHVTGTPLPPNAQHQRAWWSNNPSNNVMTKVWLRAGFKTERVDMAGRRLVFRRVQPNGTPLAGHEAPPPSRPDEGRGHPAFGALKGLVRVPPGTDLTQPADPSWAESLDEAR